MHGCDDYNDHLATLLIGLVLVLAMLMLSFGW